MSAPCSSARGASQAGHLRRRRADDDRIRMVLEVDEGSTAHRIGGLGPPFQELDRVAAGFRPGEPVDVTRCLSMADGPTRP